MGRVSSGIGTESLRKKGLLLWICGGQHSGKFVCKQEGETPECRGAGLFSLDNHGKVIHKLIQSSNIYSGMLAVFFALPLLIDEPLLSLLPLSAII